MKDFRTLDVWTRSHQFTLAVYSTTSSFPKEERYGLTSQLRRASASMPANIAEGCGKGSDADFARYLQIAFGSACEVEYHLILAKDLKYLPEDRFDEACRSLVEVKKMLSSFIKKLKADSRKPTAK